MNVAPLNAAALLRRVASPRESLVTASTLCAEVCTSCEEIWVENRLGEKRLEAEIRMSDDFFTAAASRRRMVACTSICSRIIPHRDLLKFALAVPRHDDALVEGLAQLGQAAFDGPRAAPRRAPGRSRARRRSAAAPCGRRGASRRQLAELK